jgi:hypothetical protein
MNRFAIIAFAIGSAVASRAAWASSITYSFTQNGFTDSLGDSGSVTGTFIATPEANGTIQKADVSKFFATFTETLTGGIGSGAMESFVFEDALNDFFYDPANRADFDFSTGSVASGFILCSGNNDVNTACGVGGVGNAFGFFEDLPENLGASITSQLASVTALPAIGISPAASVPEPGTLAIFATGLALLLAGSLRRRLRRSAEFRDSATMENDPAGELPSISEGFYGRTRATLASKKLCAR